MKRKIKKIKIINLGVVFILNFILIILLGGLYIYQCQEIAQKMILIKEKSKEVERLLAEKKRLEVECSQNYSFEDLSNLISDLGFEKVKRIEYIEISKAEVARK